MCCAACETAASNHACGSVGVMQLLWAFPLSFIWSCACRYSSAQLGVFCNFINGPIAATLTVSLVIHTIVNAVHFPTVIVTKHVIKLKIGTAKSVLSLEALCHDSL